MSVTASINSVTVKIFQAISCKACPAASLVRAGRDCEMRCIKENNPRQSGLAETRATR